VDIKRDYDFKESYELQLVKQRGLYELEEDIDDYKKKEINPSLITREGKEMRKIRERDEKGKEKY